MGMKHIALIEMNDLAKTISLFIKTFVLIVFFLRFGFPL